MDLSSSPSTLDGSFHHNNGESLPCKLSSETLQTLDQTFAASDIKFKNFIIVNRADPVICGHSTEGRNLAEMAKEKGFSEIHIISYPLDILANSGLPLKTKILPYSDGIHVHRPEPVGDYKVLDGRIMHGMSGVIIDLLMKMEGGTIIIDLYLVPHGRIVMDAVRAVRRLKMQNGKRFNEIVTIAEAVGSDITSQVSSCLSTGHYGSVQLILDNFLEHDILIAVSQYTKDIIVEAAIAIDMKLGTNYELQINQRCGVSYPPIDSKPLLTIASQTETNQMIYDKYGLQEQKYILFLSRLSDAKGVDDLIYGYLKSNYYICEENKIPLVIVGTGPALSKLKALAEPYGEDIKFLSGVADDEKNSLFYGCTAYVLPSKPTPSFIETFGIVVAEKMLCGGIGPVITTNTGGIPEASGPWYMHIECNSLESIACELNKVFSMSIEEKSDFSVQAQKFALQFDRAPIFENLVRLSEMKLEESISSFGFPLSTPKETIDVENVGSMKYKSLMSTQVIDNESFFVDKTPAPVPINEAWADSMTQTQSV